MSVQPEKDTVVDTDRPKTFLDGTWSWSSPSSWPLSIRFLPIGIAFAAIYIALFFPDTFGDFTTKLTADTTCIGTFNYTFQIARAKHHAETLSTHDWEIGTTAEAILELISPEKAVFSSDPFPGGKIPYGYWSMDEALSYVFENENVRIHGEPTLVYNNYSVSDPAALGVSAVMIGQSSQGWYKAAEAQKDYLVNDAPRYRNGAISHRVEVAELWSDAMFMFPPFLAYYGVASKDVGLLREAVRQIELYRDVLMIKEGKAEGLWRHIVGPSEKADEGAWSTGNGWAAYGIARVRATIAGWSTSAGIMQDAIARLDRYIEEIINGAIRTDDQECGLLKNYLDDDTWLSETAGTTLLTAAAYRAVMFKGQSITGRDRVLRWADQKRRALVKHVDEDGVARPVVDSLEHNQREPFEGINPEGESFLLLLGAAWRDCCCAGVCSADA